jgi:branched-chain amino acid transport system permease protein
VSELEAGLARRQALLGGGWVLSAVLLAALAIYPFAAPPYLLSLLTEVLIYGIFAMSLDLILGYAGLVSFGHAAFFGVGAYVAGIAAVRLNPHMGLTLPLALVAAALAALVIGYLSIRTSGIYFLMLTLAFAQVLYAVAFKWTPVTGGSNGVSGIPRPALGLVPGGGELADPVRFYFFILIVFLLVYYGLRRVVASPFGRALVGIRENEARMAAIGYDVARFKLAAFVLAGVLAGLAGALNTYLNVFVSPATLNWPTSGQVLVMVIIGGAGTLVGPVLGAGLVLLLQNLVSSQTDRWPMIMGGVFIVFVLVARFGIIGIWDRLAGRLRRPALSDPR